MSYVNIIHVYDEIDNVADELIVWGTVQPRTARIGGRGQTSGRDGRGGCGGKWRGSGADIA